MDKNLNTLPQKELIRRYLQSGKTLSQLEATELFGISRLAPRIFELKKEMSIVSKMKVDETSGKSYMNYALNAGTN